MIEVTALKVDKTEQMSTELNIRKNGGTFIRDSDTRQLIPIPDDVKTRIERRP